MPSPGLSQFNLASGGMRIAARLIDLLVTLVILVPLYIVVFTSAANADSGVESGVGLGAILGLSLIALVVGLANEIALVAIKGGSVGKLILGMRIIKTTGQPADWGTAFLRYAPNLVSMIPCLGGIASLVLLIANLVMVFSDANHQDVYDKAAKTYVIGR